MKTVRIYHLASLSSAILRLKAAQMWNVCVDAHRQARMSQACWPDRHDLHHLANGSPCQAPKNAS